MNSHIAQLLNQKAEQYNHPDFIAKDPICVPHRFKKKQDIEIAAFFAAILAWGNRTSIINSTNKIMAWMHQEPYQFVLHHQENDLKPMMQFAHRTFNATDLYYFIDFFKHHYSRWPSLEEAFVPASRYEEITTEKALIHFNNYFFSLSNFPDRTKKHIATPARKSACKRINMFLRWMVRKDKNGVDFGLWEKLQPAHLICPLDVHVANVAQRLKLLPNNKSNWQQALDLTQQLRMLKPEDPTFYDYALFGLGAEERFGAARF